eukprot:1243590-Pyramimonas_sp.AAC.1
MGEARGVCRGNRPGRITLPGPFKLTEQVALMREVGEHALEKREPGNAVKSRCRINQKEVRSTRMRREEEFEEEEEEFEEE